MTRLRRTRRAAWWPISLLGLIGLLLARPTVAAAHPLDQYLQAAYVTVAPATLTLELDLTPGVLVAPQILALLDTDGNEQISTAEGAAYAQAVLQAVTLQVDGQAQALTVTKIEMPEYLTMQAGYGTMRIFTQATLTPGLQGTHQLFYQTTYQPVVSTYQVNAFVDKGVPVQLAKQNRDALQQSLTMDYTVTGSTAASTPSATTTNAATTSAATAITQASSGTSAQVLPLLGYLYAPSSSPWVLLLGLAALLGGLHALTPGHGKTLVAAYLVGSRGTARHAVALGGIVTLTHTASVFVLGLLAIFASQLIVPGVLVPLLEIGAGGLVVVLGVRLIAARWRALRGGTGPDHAHDHSHDHDHDHEHSHDHSHEHGGHTHTHVPPAEGVSLRSLLALGVSGGLVPCPEALGIMVLAIGLNQAVLGLGLIVSFSLGLAGVLIGIGLLLVRARSLLARFGGSQSRWQRALPLVSALIVTVMGLVMAGGGLLTVLGGG